MTAAESDREALLDEAVRAGKFPESRKPTYRAALAADPGGTRALIAKLVAIGLDGSVTLPTDDAYPARWLSGSERERIAVAASVAEALQPLPSEPLSLGRQPERESTPGGAGTTPADSGAVVARKPALHTPEFEAYPAAWLTAPERVRIMMAGEPLPIISFAGND